MSHAILTYADLQNHVHEALLVQHPEWVEPDGDSPMLDAYDARFAGLLDLFQLRNEQAAIPEMAVEVLTA